MTKREAAGLIPYKRVQGEISIYLQRRSKDAWSNPDKWGLFGGGLERAETSEEGLLREIEEELCITPKNYQFLGRYETPPAYVSVYYMEVSDGFESLVNVQEGQYGRFLSRQDIESGWDSFADWAQIVLRAFFEKMD